MKLSTTVLVVILLAITGISVAAMSAARRDLAVAEANTRAAFDTTRTSLIDSVAASTRLAAQATVSTDSLSVALSEALQVRDAALVAVQRSEIAFDSVVAIGQVAVTDTLFVDDTSGDTTRVATFPLEGPPITGTQTVRVGAEILLDSRLTVSPFRVSFGVACQGASPVFAWDTPEWVRPTFESGTVDPEVCYTPPPMPILSISTGKSVWLAAGIFVGYLLGTAR